MLVSYGSCVVDRDLERFAGFKIKMESGCGVLCSRDDSVGLALGVANGVVGYPTGLLEH